MNDDAGRGDQMISRLLHGDVGGGELANELLREFQSGYPVNKLRLVVRSPHAKVVEVGIWIASELGADAKPLLPDIVGLLQHQSLKVRFFALDCLTSNAQPEDAWAVNRGLDLIEDPELSVRWKALMFLATAPEVVLRSAYNELAANTMSMKRRGLENLLYALTSHNFAVIGPGLTHNDATLRRYAAAAAARVAPVDQGPLLQAMASSDATVKQFALDMAARVGMTPYKG